MNTIKIALLKKSYMKAYSFLNKSLKGSSNITGFKKGLYNLIQVKNYRLDPPYNRRKHRPSHYILNRSYLSKLSKTFGYINKNKINFWIAHALKNVYQSHSLLYKTHPRVLKSEAFFLHPCLRRRSAAQAEQITCYATYKVWNKTCEHDQAKSTNESTLFLTASNEVCGIEYYILLSPKEYIKKRSFFKQFKKLEIIDCFYPHKTTILNKIILVLKTTTLLQKAYQNFVLPWFLPRKFETKQPIVTKYVRRKSEVFFSVPCALRRRAMLGSASVSFKKRSFFTPLQVKNQRGKSQEVLSQTSPLKPRAPKVTGLVYAPCSHQEVRSNEKKTLRDTAPKAPAPAARDVPRVAFFTAARTARRRIGQKSKGVLLHPLEDERVKKNKAFLRYSKSGPAVSKSISRTASTWLSLVHYNSGVGTRSISSLVSLLDGESSYLLWKNMFSNSLVHSKQQLRHNNAGTVVALTSVLQHFAGLYPCVKQMEHSSVSAFISQLDVTKWFKMGYVFRNY